MRPRPWLVLPICLLWASAHSARSGGAWVRVDASGKLVYRTLPRGDRIVDFSYAGYRGGGVALPRVPAARRVAPSGADDSDAIQQAIDAVSALPLQNGFRGSVVLGPGTFLCGKTISIHASGVVLRGSGAAAGGTTLRLTGDPHAALEIAGDEEIQAAGPVAHIAESYVPSGAQAITLDDASSLATGDTIRITRPTTPQWVHFMGMDHLVRDGKPETWIRNSIWTLRRIARIDGNQVVLDVPLTDSYDRKFLLPEGAEVTKVEVTGQIAQAGIEGLHMAAPPREVAFTDPLFRAINLRGLRDGWVRDVLVDDTTEGVDVDEDVARVTIENVVFRHTTTITSSAKPADFALRGTQLLVDRCGSEGNDLFYVITGARNQGPNVVLDSRFVGDGRVQPHQRWSTGLLIDNVEVPQGGIDMMNRGELGSGHGWTMGWGVVWNSLAASLVIQNPPGAANWSIGTTGEEKTQPMRTVGVHGGLDLPQGYIESPGRSVQPASLYRAQLAERLGHDALRVLEP